MYVVEFVPHRLILSSKINIQPPRPLYTLPIGIELDDLPWY